MGNMHTKIRSVAVMDGVCVAILEPSVVSNRASASKTPMISPGAPDCPEQLRSEITCFVVFCGGTQMVLVLSCALLLFLHSSVGRQHLVS